MKLVFILLFLCIFPIHVYAIIQPYNRGGFMAGVQWVGADGNRYVKDSSGTRNLGTATSAGSQYWMSQGYTGIADPNAPKASSSTDPNFNWGGSNANWLEGGQVQGASTTTPSSSYAQVSGGGDDGGAAARAAAAEAAKRQANEASRVNTQKAIDSLDTELNTGYGNIDAEQNSITSRYDKEATQNEADYNDQTVTNNQNLLKNKQNALLAGAQGARGLRGTLASLGALGGDGLKLANRAVTSEVNKDIGGATDSAATNAQTLDKSITRFRDEDKDRRDELKTQRDNQRTALEGKVESKRQGMFQKMADLFGDIGDGGNAASWLNRAGDLNGSIARKTAVAATPFTTRTAAFTPGDLADYLAGAGDMTVQTTTGDSTGLGVSPSSILAGRKKDDKKQAALLTA